MRGIVGGAGEADLQAQRLGEAGERLAEAGVGGDRPFVQRDRFREAAIRRGLAAAQIGS